MKEIEARRSIRKYKSVEIDKKIVDRLIEGARLAPSGNNRQPWHFILVTNRETREKIARTAHSQTWMLTAPLFIVCIADIKARMESDDEFYVDEETASFELKRAIRDTSIAIGHILLEAVSLGLGTCWIGWYTQKEIRPILGIPEDKFVLGIITVGYPDEAPEPRPRKGVNEIIHHERW